MTDDPYVVIAQFVQELDLRVKALEKAEAARISAARALGKKGGETRAANMTAQQRSEAARRAVNVRWKKVRR